MVVNHKHMKQLFVLTLITSLALNSFAQETKIKLLLGKSESYVKNYLDSLVKVYKTDGMYFEMDKNEYGEVSMGVYSEDDEAIIDCLAFYCFFQKVGKEQMCVRQLIGGSPEYGEKQKATLLSGFKQSSKNKWTKPFDMGFTILAEYVLEKENETYYITLSLVD